MKSPKDLDFQGLSGIFLCFCLKSGAAFRQGEPGAFGVQEDGELGSALGLGLGQEVGKELFPGGFLGHDADFVGKRQIFPGDELQ